ncbi:hypothetical protein C8Q77DRAFT_315396 [Trametes polyzona]|nr:hypothetical protein C8Q77DRAFT_315396 [Trametes polyzona]
MSLAAVHNPSSEWNVVESIFDTTGFQTVQQCADPGKVGDDLIDAPVDTRQLDLSPVQQLLTPPASEVGTVSSLEEGDCGVENEAPASTVVSISTTFYPLAKLLPVPSDFILVSSDNVLFYVHTAQLLSVSNNRFNNTIPANGANGQSKPCGDHGALARVSEPSTVLNILLHCAYGLSCAQYTPTLDILIAAVDVMPSYGLSPKAHVSPSTPLYSLILGQAPMRPFHVYALASRHDLYELAKPVSSHLLPYPPDTLPDEIAMQIGAVYLKKLCVLHAGRLEALKRLLLPPPHPHPCTPECDFAEQKKLSRAWALAAAYIAWEARADISPSTIQSALSSLADHLSCELCKQSLADRIKQLLVQWSFVTCTI